MLCINNKISNRKPQGAAWLLGVLFLFASLGSHAQTPQVLWEQAVGHPYVNSQGATGQLDLIQAVALLDTTLVAVGRARVNDSIDGISRDKLYLYAFGKKSGRKLWEQQLRINTNGLYRIERVSDTTFVLAAGHIGSGVPPAGQQKGGVTLRMFNLRRQELWKWSFYAGNSFTIYPSMLKLRQESGQPLNQARIHFAVYKYDTARGRMVHQMFTFLPQGLLERNDSAAIVGNNDIYFEQNMTHPLPGGRWLTVKWTNGIKKVTAVWLDSSFNVTKEDTLSRRLDRLEGNLALLPTPDGGFTSIYSASAIPVPGNDSSSVRLERHDGLGNVLWTQTLPRNYYYYETVNPLADGGWLWIRSTNKKQHFDSIRFYFERRDQNFGLMWQIEFPSIASASGTARYSYLDIGFDGEGGGFAVGSTSPSGNSGDNYGYVVRVTNLGLPYDPLSSKPSIVSTKGQLLAFPNPSSTITHIQGTPAKQAKLYSVQGVLLSTIKLDGQGRGSVDMGSLQKGVYMVRCGQKVVRVVKE